MKKLYILPFIFAAAVSPAFAERITLKSDAGNGDAWFARLLIENKNGVYNATETHETEHGSVSAQYTTTMPNKVGDPTSADLVCVTDMPSGVIAVPMCLHVMEQESGEILLMLFVGG